MTRAILTVLVLLSYILIFCSVSAAPFSFLKSKGKGDSGLSGIPTADTSKAQSTSSSNKSRTTSIAAPAKNNFQDEFASSSLTMVGAMSSDPHKSLKLFCYLLLWYFLTVVYNVSNKIVLNELKLPVSLCTVQLFLGIPVFLPIWILKRPKIDLVDWWQRYSKIALCHGLGNLASIMSFGAGAVSFTHIIKACEPIFAAVLSRLFLKTDTSRAVYLSLVPIVAGVAIASANELSFTWYGFICGMASNLFYQLRIVFAKIEMDRVVDEPTPSSLNSISPYPASADAIISTLESQKLQQNATSTTSANSSTITSISSAITMSPANMFRVLTIIAVLQMIPVALICEGHKVYSTWTSAVMSGAPIDYLVSNIVISGVSYYLYNEVAFWILALVSPITHAIGNTIKRVVIIFASILILKTPINAQGILGSTIAIAGTLVYSLVLQNSSKDKANKKETAE